MPKFTISKAITTVFFVVLAFFFFAWIVSNLTDLTLFFGFRLSYTVANDIAGLIQVLGSTPGTVEYTYEKAPTQIVKEQGLRVPIYSVQIQNNFVCVSSKTEQGDTTTVDCASFPGKFQNKIELTDVGTSENPLCIKFRKTFEEDEVKFFGTRCDGL